jgi:hypothetical protein
MKINAAVNTTNTKARYNVSSCMPKSLLSGKLEDFTMPHFNTEVGIRQTNGETGCIREKGRD